MRAGPRRSRCTERGDTHSSVGSMALSMHPAPRRRWPSGASWSVSLQEGDDSVAVNLDAWDFGLEVERRLWGGAFGGFYASLEVGVGGLRGLRLQDSELETPDLDVSSSAFLSLDFKFRPGLPSQTQKGTDTSLQRAFGIPPPIFVPLSSISPGSPR
jgi:hypothetical protein